MGKTAEAIAEGVSIASAAARLAIRNRILVETIAHDEQFDVVAFTPFARETLTALADEQDEAAALVRRQRKKAWGKFTDSDGTHDYRDRDTRNLRRRGRQYSGVAQALRRMADDPHVVRSLIEQSRDAAWGDVEANLQRRLRVEGMRPDLDPDYERMRAARMQSIRLVDIPRLAAHKRHREEADTDAEPAAEPAAASPRISGVDVTELDS
ncbi:asparagine synthase [Microbacterium sp. B35-04]|uniref:asparagine synthase n=1 Tax=unclassified Microbacterium TaxID=2609290 RepID=UPI0013D3BB4E|nr:MULTISPECIES: asparagine synthase [unclassified Microbacterium]KAF2413493.1 asparagine synthase [Microbacterium sp. B35-04]KAF2417802.1 asparagine synthase [Microbacterium sp. B35-30]